MNDYGNKISDSDQDNQAIIEAALYGRFEIVKVLLSDARVNPSARCNEAFVAACRNGNIEVFKLLLSDPRVDPTDKFNQDIAVVTEKMYAEFLVADDPSNRMIKQLLRLIRTQNPNWNRNLKLFNF